MSFALKERVEVIKRESSHFGQCGTIMDIRTEGREIIVLLDHNSIPFVSLFLPYELRKLSLLELIAEAAQ